MSRDKQQQFIRTVVLVLAGMLAPSLVAGQKSSARPNVLFIAVDDLRPELGCYGNSWIKSPNIDRLAGRGMVFNRAYCQVPTCGASRASLLTGLRPTPKRFRSYKTYAEKDAPGAATLPEEFKKNGYHCISNGKIFHHAEDTAGRSWSEPPWRPAMGGRDTFDPASKNMISSKTQRGPVFESPDVPDNAYRDGQVADKTIKDLKRLKDTGKPFFLACGFWKPHLPFYAPKRYWDLYDRDKITLATNRQMPKNAPKLLRGSGEIRTYHSRDIKYNSEEWHRSLRHGYYACVSYIDAQIGRVLRTLDELGLSDNTIVILWGDHGWHLGEHNFWGKHNLMNLAVNSPLIVVGPGVLEGQTTDRLVEFVDIYPALCDMAGIPTINQGLQGTSFKPLLSAPRKPWKKAAFCMFGKSKSLVTERYNFVEFTDGEKILYDLERDPQEDVNIAGEPENIELVRTLSRRLEEGWKAARP
jgi:arylsulfatase A-like enzyme